MRHSVKVIDYREISEEGKEARGRNEAKEGDKRGWQRKKAEEEGRREEAVNGIAIDLATVRDIDTATTCHSKQTCNN